MVQYVKDLGGADHAIAVHVNATENLGEMKIFAGPFASGVITYKIYSPEKFKKQYEEEIAAKRAERKKKQTVTVQENGKNVTREVSLAEANKLRLEEARRREAELYKDERTTPLHQD